MFWDTIKHFSEDEFTEDPSKVSHKLVLLMDSLREKAGVGIVIHEAWASSGHAPKSYHYSGLAVDFHFTGLDPLTQWGILSSCREIGGLGYYPDWNHPGWHIDLRPSAYRLTWLAHKHNYTYGPNVITDFLYKELHE